MIGSCEINGDKFNFKVPQFNRWSHGIESNIALL